MEIATIVMIILMALIGFGAATVITLIMRAERSGKNAEWFAKIRQQAIENEKTPEGRERNRRFLEFLRMHAGYFEAV